MPSSCALKVTIYFIMGLGIAFFIIGIREAGTTTLMCRRPEPGQINCHQERSIWFGLVTLSDADFNRVQKVRLQRTDKGTLYARLITASGETSLYDFPQDQMSDLKAFINSTEPALLVQQSRWVNVLVAWLIGGLLTGGGGLVLRIFKVDRAETGVLRINQDSNKG